MHFFWGLAILCGVPFFGSPSKNDPPPFFGLFMMAMGAGIIFLGLVPRGMPGRRRRSIAAKKRHLFCLVMAGLMCVLCNPLGTVLGIFTIVVLMRPSVKALFGVEDGMTQVGPAAQ